MPIPTEVEYLDGEFKVPEQEPATIQEVIEIIGEDAVRDEAVSNLRYRNKYPRVYRKVSAAIEKEFPRPQAEKDGAAVTKTYKDGTVKPVLVSEMDHLRKFLESGPEARERLEGLFSEIAPSEPLYVKGERTGGGGKIAQSALDAANGLLAKGDEAVEKAISVIEEQIGGGYKVGRNGENEVSPESLARGIQALNKKLQADALKASKAALGV